MSTQNPFRRTRQGFDRLATKDKFAVALSVVAIVVSVAALVVSTMLARSSNGTANSAFQLAKTEARAQFTTTVFIQRPIGDKPGVRTNLEALDSTETYTLSRAESTVPGTYLGLTITNLGTKPVDIQDVGLLTDTGRQRGYWRTEAVVPPMKICNETHSQHIYCFKFPVVVPVGEQRTFYIPLWERAADLFAAKATRPVILAVRSLNASYPGNTLIRSTRVTVQ